MMTRNQRMQLADLGERWIRAWAGDVPRESAEVMLTYWDLAEPVDEDLIAEVLGRFAPAEPPTVPGLDFLPDTQADAAVLVAEAVAVLDEPKAERHCNDCGHAESRHSRLNCNGTSETERCWCYAFRLPERAS